ncbi:MAG: TenA family protein [Pseudomonadota bacterium]
MSLSGTILERNEAVLNAMLTHRFVEDVCADGLPIEVFKRYLAYEGAFVETAIAIFSFATARAPDMDAKRWMIGVLDALANVQVPYFEERYRTLDIERPDTLPDDARAFDTGMLELAEQGSFLDILTAMFAAEWMYWTWCKRASKIDLSNQDLAAWIRLHVDDAFAAQALWLKDAIDRYGVPQDSDRLSQVFGTVTALEIRFHDAPYVVKDVG